jgi:8-oxo-dGTP pyrophosphatase MutT (NUDIX family)
MDALPLAGTVVLLRDGATPEALILTRPARGSFAGAWVVPGGLVEPADRAPEESGQDAARTAAARECFEEVGLLPVGLVPLSRWIPPAQAPKRVGTWFFLAADPGGTVVPSPDEVVDSAWISPADALQRHADGDIELYPPTWVTLHDLLAFGDADAALAAAGAARLYATQIEGTTFRWEGLRLETRELPWTLTGE